MTVPIKSSCLFFIFFSLLLFCFLRFSPFVNPVASNLTACIVYMFIIYQIFLLVRNFSRHIMWLKTPQLEQRNIHRYFQIFNMIICNMISFCLTFNLIRVSILRIYRKEICLFIKLCHRTRKSEHLTLTG